MNQDQEKAVLETLRTLADAYRKQPTDRLFATFNILAHAFNLYAYIDDDPCCASKTNPEIYGSVSLSDVLQPVIDILSKQPKGAQ